MDKYSFRQTVSTGDSPWTVYKATLSKWDDGVPPSSADLFWDFCQVAPGSTKIELANSKEIKTGESQILSDSSNGEKSADLSYERYFKVPGEDETMSFVPQTDLKTWMVWGVFASDAENKFRDNNGSPTTWAGDLTYEVP